MFDGVMPKINKPELDPEVLKLLKGIGDNEPVKFLEFGDTAIQGVGFTDIRDPYRPRFFDVERNRGTELVDMDARGQITVDRGQEKRIATFGLGGCTAVAVTAELSDGTRKGYVQHYNPLNKSLSTDALGEATRGISAGATSTRAVIMTPGEWAQDPAAKWGMVAKDQTLTGLLTVVAQQGLGTESDIQVRPYSKMQNGEYGEGTLMIEFKPDGETVILADLMTIHPVSANQP